MKLNELIKKLNEILQNNGDSEVLMFDTQAMMSRPVIDVKFIVQEDFREDLKDDPMYVDNFKRELETPTII